MKNLDDIQEIYAQKNKDVRKGSNLSCTIEDQTQYPTKNENSDLIYYKSDETSLQNKKDVFENIDKKLNEFGQNDKRKKMEIVKLNK